MLRTMSAISVICFLGLQYIYWFGPSGYTNLLTLADKVNEQKLMNMALKEQNRLLITEVEALFCFYIILCKKRK